MNHFRLTPEVWKLLNEHFYITEEKEELKELLPSAFVDFMVDQINRDIGFPYNLFRGEDTADYDAWMELYFQMRNAAKEGNTSLAWDIWNALENTGIYHPLAEMEKYKLMVLENRKEESIAAAKGLLALYPNETEILIAGSQILYDSGLKEEAAGIYMRILSRLPEHYVSNIRIGKYYVQIGDYRKAKRFLEKAAQINPHNQEIWEWIRDVNAHLIKEYLNIIAGKNADMDTYILFGQCCLENDEVSTGIDCLIEAVPDEKHASAYHSIMTSLYGRANLPEKAEKEGEVWIESIIKEEKRLSEEEKYKVSQQIADACYKMGKAWMYTKNDEKALEYMDRALSFNKYKTDAYLQKAIIFSRNGRYETCIDTCDLLLETDPDNFWGYIYRMDAFFNLKNVQGMMDDFNQAKDINPDYPPMYEKAAELLDNCCQYRYVLNIAEEARKYEINTPILHMLRFRAMNRMAETREEAEEMLALAHTFLEAEESTQENASVYAQIYAETARAYGKLGEYRKALACINKAIGYENKSHFYWIKGNLLLDMDNNKEALHNLLKCEKDFPEGDRVTFRIGECYANMGKNSRAALYFEKTLQINPEHERANYMLAQMYRELLIQKEEPEFYKKGLLYADRQLEVSPNAYYYIERGLLHMEGGRFRDAITDFQEAAAREPENVYAFNNMCACYRMLGEYDSAIQAGKNAEAVMRREDTAKVYGYLGDCYMEMRDYEQGLLYYHKHQKQFPKGRAPIESIIRINCRMKRIHIALYWIQQIYGHTPEAAYYHKAEVCASLGEIQKARSYLKILLKGDYEPGKVRLLYAILLYYFFGKKRDAIKTVKQARKLVEQGSDAYFIACILLQEIYYRIGKFRIAKKLGEEHTQVWMKIYKSPEAVTDKWKTCTWRLSVLGLISYYAGNLESVEKCCEILSGTKRCKECLYTECIMKLYLKALLFEDNNDREAALACYKKIREISPGFYSGAFGIIRLQG